MGNADPIIIREFEDKVDEETQSTNLKFILQESILLCRSSILTPGYLWDTSNVNSNIRIC